MQSLLEVIAYIENTAELFHCTILVRSAILDSDYNHPVIIILYNTF